MARTNRFAVKCFYHLNENFTNSPSGAAAHFLVIRVIARLYRFGYLVAATTSNTR